NAYSTMHNPLLAGRQYLSLCHKNRNVLLLTWSLHSVHCSLLPEPHTKNPNTVPQMICIALRFFASGTCMRWAMLRSSAKIQFAEQFVIALQRLYINTFIGCFDLLKGFPRVFGVLLICIYFHYNLLFTLLCQRFHEGLFDSLLVGDRTYTKPQHDFNMALSQTRLKIDMTFAILKARFNCYFHDCDLRLSPERSSQIVGACVIPHNKEWVDHPSDRAVRDATTAENFTYGMEHMIKQHQTCHG
uniref:DDE Tnp4 domain-containing protein n=1 Tax=Cyprinus carpio TaxID=7962 RepID=A0A8C1TXT2_CYPCA